jgi:broad-specificity NMP kinase
VLYEPPGSLASHKNIDKENSDMPNLIVVSGPQAVGKMTVAESLRDKLKYNLMINHDSIEISDRIFGFATPAQKEFNRVFREKAFEIAVKNNVDLIFTFVCAYDYQADIDYLMWLKKMFESNGGHFYFVELITDLNTRLERNTTPHRMEMKFSKKNVARSEADLLKTAKNHRLNSNEDETLCENHIKIDNTYLSPDDVADMVIERFSLVANDREENEYRFGF